MSRALCVLILAVTACSPATSDSFDFLLTRSVAGERIELSPGEEVLVPIRIDVPGEGDAEFTVQATAASHGSEPFTGLRVGVVSESGDLVTEEGRPLWAACRHTCRGTNHVELALNEDADAPVTVDWWVYAVAYMKGGRGSEVLTVDVGEVELAREWETALDAAGISPAGSVGRLHLTSPLDPEGSLRLELPGIGNVETASPVLLDGSVSPPAGSSLPLVPPPDSCGQVVCDWSLAVASVVPWRVMASTGEFNVSYTALDEGVLGGKATWRGPVEAGSEVELQLDIRSPDFDGTDALIQVGLYEMRGQTGRRLPNSVTVRVGSQSVAHDTPSPSAAWLLAPLECHDETCEASIPVHIDARSREDGIEVGLRFAVSIAAPPPTAGEVILEVGS